MGHAFWACRRALVFLLCFTFEVHFADANQSAEGPQGSSSLFAEKPEKCSQFMTYPCALSSGQQPHYFMWGKSRWELAKDTVVSGQRPHKWRAAFGQFVLKAKDNVIVETPFADLHLAASDVFVELTETRLKVSVIAGEEIKIYPRGDGEEHLLSAGFMNWYSGIGPQGQELGIPTVIDLQVYAQQRAYFFTDHKLGFINELKQLAANVKQASLVAAEMHQRLVAEKRALLQAAYDDSVARANRRREFDRFLRQLFHRKVNYDDQDRAL